MGDTSQEWQAVGDVAVGDMVGSYDPMTGRWMCGRYDACRAIQATSLRPWDGEQMALPSELSGTVKRYTQLAEQTFQLLLYSEEYGVAAGQRHASSGSTATAAYAKQPDSASLGG